jgi:hypothetical protein
MLKPALIEFAKANGLPDANDDMTVADITEALENLGVEIPKDAPKQTEPPAPAPTQPQPQIERVTFTTPFNSLSVTVRPSRTDIIDGHAIFTKGKTVRFERGVLTTDDAETIAFLRDGRNGLGRDYFEVRSQVISKALRG